MADFIAIFATDFIMARENAPGKDKN